MSCMRALLFLFKELLCLKSCTYMCVGVCTWVQMPAEGWVPRAGVKSSSKLLSRGAWNGLWVLCRSSNCFWPPRHLQKSVFLIYWKWWPKGFKGYCAGQSCSPTWLDLESKLRDPWEDFLEGWQKWDSPLSEEQAPLCFHKQVWRKPSSAFHLSSFILCFWVYLLCCLWGWWSCLIIIFFLMSEFSFFGLPT